MASLEDGWRLQPEHVQVTFYSYVLLFTLNFSWIQYTNQRNFSLTDGFLGQSRGVKFEKFSVASDPTMVGPTMSLKDASSLPTTPPRSFS